MVQESKRLILTQWWRIVTDRNLNITEANQHQVKISAPARIKSLLSNQINNIEVTFFSLFLKFNLIQL